MFWTDGDVWHCVTRLPPRQDIEFKLVVWAEDYIEWQSGENIRLQVEGDAKVRLHCKWEPAAQPVRVDVCREPVAALEQGQLLQQVADSSKLLMEKLERLERLAAQYPAASEGQGENSNRKTIGSSAAAEQAADDRQGGGDRAGQDSKQVEALVERQASMEVLVPSDSRSDVRATPGDRLVLEADPQEEASALLDQEEARMQEAVQRVDSQQAPGWAGPGEDKDGQGAEAAVTGTGGASLAQQASIAAADVSEEAAPATEDARPISKSCRPDEQLSLAAQAAAGDAPQQPDSRAGLAVRGERPAEVGIGGSDEQGMSEKGNASQADKSIASMQLAEQESAANAQYAGPNPEEADGSIVVEGSATEGQHRPQAAPMPGGVPATMAQQDSSEDDSVDMPIANDPVTNPAGMPSATAPASGPSQEKQTDDPATAPSDVQAAAVASSSMLAMQGQIAAAVSSTLVKGVKSQPAGPTVPQEEKPLVATSAEPPAAKEPVASSETLKAEEEQGKKGLKLGSAVTMTAAVGVAAMATMAAGVELTDITVAGALVAAGATLMGTRSKELKGKGASAPALAAMVYGADAVKKVGKAIDYVSRGSIALPKSRASLESRGRAIAKQAAEATSGVLLDGPASASPEKKPMASKAAPLKPASPQTQKPKPPASSMRAPPAAPTAKTPSAAKPVKPTAGRRPLRKTSSSAAAAALKADAPSTQKLECNTRPPSVVHPPGKQPAKQAQLPVDDGVQPPGKQSAQQAQLSTEDSSSAGSRRVTQQRLPSGDRQTVIDYSGGRIIIEEPL